MIRTDLIKERINACGLTQAKMAQQLGMTPRTFYKRMKSGVFRSDEMETMAAVLGFKNPADICVFCASKGVRDGAGM